MLNTSLYGKRHFLFLQGPISPFFNEIAYELKNKGHQCISKIQLCYSDCLWWEHQLIPFTQPIDQFPIFINKMIQEKKITDIILLGDCRQYHHAAIKVAKTLCHIWVFEEGYIRPDTITLEHNSGANGYSKIPNQASFYQNTKLTNMPIKSIQSNLKTRINWDLKYHIGNYFNKQKFSYYQHHRGDKIWQEYLGWSKRFGINFFIGKQNIKKNLKSFENKEYFLVPLQLSCDFQISHHSYYRNTQEMVAEVITSFEIHAKKDTHLVFKIHPFDTLILNNIKYIKKLIKNNTFLKHRVTILDGGHLPTLIDNAQGVIVINSTVGLQALYHQAPTKALGNAIYNFEGLTDQKPLNEFWQNPSKPDTELFKKFRTHLLHHNQINGGFYSLDGIKTAAPIVAEKMHKAQMLQ